MKLTFGDLAGKAAAERAISDEQMQERRVTMAAQAIKHLAVIPDEGAALWDFPEHLQHWGLTVLREAARQCRAGSQA